MLARITPKEIRKNGGKVPMGQSLYFTIFQTMLCGSDEESDDEMLKTVQHDGENSLKK